MEKSITVTGSASVTLTADLCTVEMTVEEKNKDYGKATDSMNEKLGLLRKACAENGLGKELKTTSYNVRADYVGVNENGIYKNVFDGYVCSYGLSLSFDFDADKLASLLSAVSSCGSSARVNVSFSVKDPAAAEAQLLEAVCDDAKKKAETICRRLDAYMGKLIRVQQGGGAHSMRSRTEYGCDNQMPQLAKSAAFSPDITPSDITVTSEAVFEWEIL